MFTKKLLWQALTYSKLKYIKPALKTHQRTIQTSVLKFKENEDKDSKEKKIVVRQTFDSQPNKTKQSYLDMVHIFINRDVHRRGHVEFIYSALKHMQLYGVQKDLEVYKSLIDVFPKEKMIPKNIFQAEFMHYPKQQQCAIDLLEQMEDNGVMPDAEMETMLLSVFGKRGHPLRKYWRMMYWMPKFKNLSPWPVPNPPPNDVFDLAQMAIARISSADVQSKISIYNSKEVTDSIDDTWIVSAQSPKQKELLAEQDVKQPVYVEGSFRVWLRDRAVDYFVLRTAAKPIPEDEEDPDDVSKLTFPSFMGIGTPPKKKLAVIPSVHEQEDGVILSVCATGTSSKDSLLSWIRMLEKDGNPKLAQVPVVFTLKSPETGIVNVETATAEDTNVEPVR